MAKVSYRSGSVYSATPQTSWYLDTLVLRDIQPHPSDKLVTLENKYHMKPMNYSRDLYGTKDLWWIFQILNMDVIRDPIYDFKAGIQIYVPTAERVNKVLRNGGA